MDRSGDAAGGDGRHRRAHRVQPGAGRQEQFREGAGARCGHAGPAGRHAGMLSGLIGRLAIFVAVAAGYLLALGLGEVDTSAIGAADWIGLPHFQTPTFVPALLLMFLRR